MKSAVLMVGLAVAGWSVWPVSVPLAQPVTDVVQRDWLLAASTEAVEPMISAMLREAVAAKAIPPTRLNIVPNAVGFSRFCRGTGPQEPDVLAVARRMSRIALDTCQRNDVGDIIEMRLGYEALVVATKAGDPRLELTSYQVYRALAAEVPDGDHLAPNAARTWKAVDSTLPDIDIRVVGPSDGAARAMVNDLLLQGGCRREPLVHEIFSARTRVEKCVVLRRDGVFLGAADGRSGVAALLAAPAGAIGILGFGDVVASAGQLAPLALDGVVPSYQTIANDEYDFTRAIYVYVKRAHLRDDRGVGVVRGLKQLMTHLASEQTIGPSGYLAPTGLVSLPARERVEQRRRLDSLQRYEP